MSLNKSKTNRGDSLPRKLIVASTLRIRGIATLNSGEQAEPLVLVDGAERNFNEIDPNEIETINILKNASATAVFGVRGANEVIFNRKVPIAKLNYIRISMVTPIIAVSIFVQIWILSLAIKPMFQ